MMKTLRRICTGAACPLLALLILVGPVAAATWITGPTVITEPGEYRLASDIVNTDAPVCIDVQVGGVKIDGRGHLVDGVKTSGAVGVRIQWTGTAAPDTIVKNIRFTDWGSGIQLYKAMHPKVRSCTFTDDTIGVESYCANDMEVSSCTFVENGDGVSLAGTTDAVIRDSTFSDNANGISLGFGLQVSNIIISSNTIDGSSGAGIRLNHDTGPVTIRSNRITNNGGAGLVLNEVSGHVITNNLFNNMNNAGVAAPVTNTWNLEPVRGKNIVGGRRLGGNYWAKPDGTGFSQVTPDANRDGFCDAPYTIADLNVDLYPLHAK